MKCSMRSSGFHRGNWREYFWKYDGGSKYVSCTKPETPFFGSLSEIHALSFEFVPFPPFFRSNSIIVDRRSLEFALSIKTTISTMAFSNCLPLFPFPLYIFGLSLVSPIECEECNRFALCIYAFPLATDPLSLISDNSCICRISRNWLRIGERSDKEMTIASSTFQCWLSNCVTGGVIC